jgi:hypothetical protein
MRSTKSEWFSRLRSGAGGQASRQRPSVNGGLAQPDHNGSSTRFTTALKLWLLSTLPVVQITSRSASASKARPPGHPSAGADGAPPPEQPKPAATAHGSDGDQAQPEDSDAKLKQLQIQALEDEHELQPLKRREHEISIENAEIKRGLTLAGVVVIGAMLVAGLVLAVADPGALHHSGFNFWEACKIFLG